MTIATVALAVIAGLQLFREVTRGYRRRRALRRRLAGVAWLARRSCEVTVRSAPGDHMDHRIATRFTSSPGLDRLQRHFREVLALSSAIGGTDAEHGEKAFEWFLAAADRLNEIIEPTTPATGLPTAIPGLCEEGLYFLYDAIVELAHLAHRRPHEPTLPAREMLARPPWPRGGQGAPPTTT